MAEYKGLFEVNGSLGEMFFYTLNGTKVVRRRSGFNADDYKNNPSYAKIRRNTSEFGHCSQVGKVVRIALREVLNGRSDKYLYQRVAKLMTQIKDLDGAPHGSRTVFGGLADGRWVGLPGGLVTDERQRAVAEGLTVWVNGGSASLMFDVELFDYGQEIVLTEVVVSGDLKFERREHFRGCAAAETEVLRFDLGMDAAGGLHVAGVGVGNWCGIFGVG